MFTDVRAKAAQAKEAADAARTANRVAGELGLTPEQALSGAQKGAAVAQSLGVTPQQALKFGISGMKALDKLDGGRR